MSRFLLALAAVASMLLSACTDAATRVAYDIESGVNSLGAQEGARRDIAHVPRSWPAGCSGSYALRISKGHAINEGYGNFHIGPDSGGIGVSCYNASGGQVGYGTTYHLRFVDVPATVTVNKGFNETAFIEVQRIDGRAVVVGLR